MTRPLTAGMQTAVAAQTGTMVWLIEIEASGGTTRISTASQDIAWNAQTWEGIGGEFQGIEESADMSGGQGAEITLSGVDQTIIGLLLNNNVRGRDVRIYLAHVADAGTIVADPLPVFDGVQLSDHTIRETITDEQPTCDVTFHAVSRLALLAQSRAVRTNEHSHNAMLARAGLATGDTFFQHVPELQGRAIVWGGRPVSGTGGANGWSPGDRDHSG